MTNEEKAQKLLDELYSILQANNDEVIKVDNKGKVVADHAKGNKSFFRHADITSRDGKLTIAWKQAELVKKFQLLLTAYGALTNKLEIQGADEAMKEIFAARERIKINND